MIETMVLKVPQWPELVGLRDIDDETKIAGYVWWQPPDEEIDLASHVRTIHLTPEDGRELHGRGSE